MSVEQKDSMTPEKLREHFEFAVNTAMAEARIPMGVVKKKGVFAGYKNYDTQTFWMGFQLGMRHAQELEKWEKTCRPLQGES